MQDTTPDADDGIDPEVREAGEGSSSQAGGGPRPGEAFHARRGALYGYVATAFQFPDADAFDDLRDDAVTDAVGEAAAGLAMADDDAEGLVEHVETVRDALAAASRDDLERGYNALFGLPDDDGTYPVVPYEARYATTGDVNDVQRRVATVVGLLERFDLEPHDGFAERQDHVAVLLELAEVLAAERAVAIAEGADDAAATLAEAEATVLDEHLLGFVPALARDVGDAIADADVPEAARDAYVAAADLAAALVEWDHASHPDPAVDGVDAGETPDPDGAVGGDRR